MAGALLSGLESMHMHVNYFFERDGFATSDFEVMVYEIMPGLCLCMRYA